VSSTALSAFKSVLVFVFAFITPFYPFTGLLSRRRRVSTGRRDGVWVVVLLARLQGQFCFCMGFARGLECRLLFAPGILDPPLGSCGTALGFPALYCCIIRAVGGGCGTYGREGCLEPAVVVLGDDWSRRKIVYIDTTTVLVWFGFGDDGFRHRNGSIALVSECYVWFFPSLSRMGCCFGCAKAAKAGESGSASVKEKPCCHSNLEHLCFVDDTWGQWLEA
jgi:hypothetical protein